MIFRNLFFIILIINNNNNDNKIIQLAVHFFKNRRPRIKKRTRAYNFFAIILTNRCLHEDRRENVFSRIFTDPQICRYNISRRRNESRHSAIVGAALLSIRIPGKTWCYRFMTVQTAWHRRTNTSYPRD